MSELRVNVPELRSGGKSLEEAAASLPDPPQPFTTTGSDPLSVALTKMTQEAEASIIDSLPPIKNDARKMASDIGVAADMYEKTDQELSDAIMKRLAEFDTLFGGQSLSSHGRSDAPLGSDGQFGSLVHGV